MRNSLIRNLIIIIGLLVAIYFVYGRYQKREEEVAARQAENDRIEAENKQKAAEKRKEAAELRSQLGGAVDKPERRAPKTQAEELAELRFGLRDGDRNRFPKGTQKLGDSWYLLVNEAMSWIEANEFADRHGGRLAVFESGESLLEVVTQNESPRAAWLGAGDAGGGKFRWVDGSKWQGSGGIEAPNRMVAVSADGTLMAKDSRALSPFFLEWTEAPAPAGSVTAILENFNPELDSLPVGAITVGKQSYFISSSASSWTDARSKAEKLGGTLAVASEKKEGILMAKLVRFRMPEGIPVWIGGQSEGSEWKWITGEKGIDVNSVEVVADHALSIEVDGAKPIVSSHPKNGSGSYFMVEWGGAAEQSEEGKVVKVPKATPEQVAKLLKLKEKAAGAAAKIEADIADELKDNTKDLAFDLRAWNRTLASTDQERFAGALNSILASLEGELIPDKQGGGALPQKPLDIYQRHLSKQTLINQQRGEKVEALRDAYLKRLEILKSEAAGDEGFTRRISAEAERAGGDKEEFLRYLKR